MEIKKWIIRIIILLVVIMALQCAFFPNSAFIKGWTVEENGTNVSYNLLQYGTVKSLVEDGSSVEPNYLFNCGIVCCAINQKVVDIGIAQDKCVTSNSDNGTIPSDDNQGVTPDENQGETTPIVCAGIWNPSQSTCAAGYCADDEICTLHEATLTAPASCSCDTI